MMLGGSLFGLAPHCDNSALVMHSGFHRSIRVWSTNLRNKSDRLWVRIPDTQPRNFARVFNNLRSRVIFSIELSCHSTVG